jgi:hypothetical protein
VAEGTRLLSEYGGKPPSRVRIPPSPFRKAPAKRDTLLPSSVPRVGGRWPFWKRIWKRENSVTLRRLTIAPYVRQSSDPPPILRWVAQFSPKYTEEQKHAIARLVVDERKTVRRALAEIAAGKAGVAPFEMPTSTAHRIVREAREQRGRARFDALWERSPYEAMDDLVRRQARLVAHAIEEISTEAAANGRIGLNDAKGLAVLAQCLRTLRATVGKHRVPELAPEHMRAREQKASAFIELLAREDAADGGGRWGGDTGAGPAAAPLT